MKYSEEDYLEFDVSGGDDIEIRCRTRKLIKTRKDHPCCASNAEHIIPRGTICLCDRAIVDGEWSVVYVCLPCIEEWYDKIEIYKPVADKIESVEQKDDL
jgi:hypothetical protein